LWSKKRGTKVENPLQKERMHNDNKKTNFTIIPTRFIDQAIDAKSIEETYTLFENLSLGENTKCFVLQPTEIYNDDAQNRH
jgi:hypothetical protein